MIEIRKGGTLRTTWEELKTSIKNNTSSLDSVSDSCGVCFGFDI